MTTDLFDDLPPGDQPQTLAPGAVLLRGFARAADAALLQALEGVIAQAPFRHLVTPGGHTMSVAMSNCGALGWISDRSGYRYSALDPLSGQNWPTMPVCFLELATATWWFGAARRVWPFTAWRHWPWVSTPCWDNGVST